MPGDRGFTGLRRPPYAEEASRRIGKSAQFGVTDYLHAAAGRLCEARPALIAAGSTAPCTDNRPNPPAAPRTTKPPADQSLNHQIPTNCAHP